MRTEMGEAPQQPIYTDREDHRVAWFAALAIAIHVLEAGFPSPLPGVKPGLANVVTLLVLYLYGWRLAAWVSFLRVLVGSLIIGSFLSPAFFLSFSGASAAVVVLGILKPIPILSPWGLAVGASMAHMAAQFTAAYYLFIPHPGLLKLLPLLLLAAFVFGLLSGYITRLVLQKVNT